MEASAPACVNTLVYLEKAFDEIRATEVIDDVLPDEVDPLAPDPLPEIARTLAVIRDQLHRIILDRQKAGIVADPK